MKKDSIVKEGLFFKSHLNYVILTSDDGMLVGMIPSLLLSVHHRDQEEVISRLKSAVKSFFNFYDTEDKLLKELNRLGWNDYTCPHNLSVPFDAMFYPREIGALEYINS